MEEAIKIREIVVSNLSKDGRLNNYDYTISKIDEILTDFANSQNKTVKEELEQCKHHKLQVISDYNNANKTIKVKEDGVTVMDKPTCLKGNCSCGEEQVLDCREWKKEWHQAPSITETQWKLNKAKLENEKLNDKIDFIKSKGLKIGMMSTTDKDEPYLAYVIEEGSELDDTITLEKLLDAEIELQQANETITQQKEVIKKAYKSAFKEGYETCKISHGLRSNFSIDKVRVDLLLKKFLSTIKKDISYEESIF